MGCIEEAVRFAGGEGDVFSGRGVAIGDAHGDYGFAVVANVVCDLVRRCLIDFMRERVSKKYVKVGRTNLYV